MENIIGREAEIKKLQAISNSQHAEFVALYGRRRVGKTFLGTAQRLDVSIHYAEKRPEEGDYEE